MAQIQTALLGVMRDVEPIAKSRFNDGQRFNFRGIDDVYAALHPLFAKHGVFVLPSVLEQRHEERTSAKGNPQVWTVIRMQYTFMADDGSSVSCSTVGESLDTGDKSAGKAQSYAHKVALLQCFCVPVADAEDPDRHSPKMGTRGRRESAPSAPSTPAPSQAAATETPTYSDNEKQRAAVTTKAREFLPAITDAQIDWAAKKLVGTPLAEVPAKLKGLTEQIAAKAATNGTHPPASPTAAAKSTMPPVPF